MKTRRAQAADVEAWVELRRALWPDSDLDSLPDEARAVLASDDQACFLLVDPADRPLGFAEVAVHPGTDGPYAHVEGWYVLPEFRGRGYGRLLMHEVEQWSLHRAIRHLTSDTDPSYPLSPAAHARAGFRKISEFTIFVRELPTPPRGDE